MVTVLVTPEKGFNNIESILYRNQDFLEDEIFQPYEFTYGGLSDLKIRCL